MKKRLFRGVLVAFAFFALAAPVLANDAFYNWTMNLRVVDNHIDHTLTAGALHHGGQVWPYSTDSGHSATPIQVNLDVYHDDWIDSEVCTVSITPNTTFNVGKQFDKDCGTVAAGSYYIVVWKSFDDGWNEKGQGGLVTH